MSLIENHFDVLFRALQESGALHVILERYDDLMQKKCYGQVDSEEHLSFSYQKVIFPFTIVLIGIVFACIIFGIEIVVFSSK